MSRAPLEVTFRVEWSDEDGEWVATSSAFGPRLSNLHPDQATALAGMLLLAAGAIDDLKEEGRPMPWQCPACDGRGDRGDAMQCGACGGSGQR